MFLICTTTKKRKTGFLALIVLLQLVKLANKNCDHLCTSTSTWYINVINLDNTFIWSHYLTWVGGGLDSYLLNECPHFILVLNYWLMSLITFNSPPLQDLFVVRDYSIQHPHFLNREILIAKDWEFQEYKCIKYHTILGIKQWDPKSGGHRKKRTKPNYYQYVWLQWLLLLIYLGKSFLGSIHVHWICNRIVSWLVRLAHPLAWQKLRPQARAVRGHRGVHLPSAVGSTMFAAWIK